MTNSRQHVGYLIKVIDDKLQKKADMDLKQHDLTMMQSRVLAFLAGKGGHATQKEVEVFLEVAHPTVVGIISRMERADFLISYPDREDKRNKIVELTAKSHRIGQEIERTINTQEKKLLAGMSAEQVAELERLLNIIYKNLD